MRTITSANSQFVLTIPDVFPAPVVMQGYAADDAFSVEAFDVAETLMGVDGNMSAGFVPNVKKLTFMLQADSPSLAAIEAWLGAMETAREVIFASAVIVLPSTQRTYIFTKGVLTNAKKLPDGKKVLQPVPYVITWQDIKAVLI